MIKKKILQQHPLDKEEQKLLQSIERGEWTSVKNQASELKRYASYAKNTLKKDCRISVRLSHQDLVGIQGKAVEEGLPYQTLITSVIHKYVAGRLGPVRANG